MVIKAITEEYYSPLAGLIISKARSESKFSGTLELPSSCSCISIQNTQQGNKIAPFKGARQKGTHDEGTTINENEGENSTNSSRIIMAPYNYLEKQPGKNIRKQFITAFNAWLHISEDRLAVIVNVVTMLHTASLLIDDIQDSSLLRRGIPVAHNVFGIAQTINSANYVYFLALQEVQKLENPVATSVFSQEILNLHQGQGMELFWRDTLKCPTEDEYLDMVGDKTGGLFRLAIRLMQAESEVKRDFIPLVNLLGVIFQICDDFLNLADTKYCKTKGLCEDLTEGKFSYLVVHSIRSDPDDLTLINILKQRTNNRDVKMYAVSQMKKTGSFTYTQKTVARLKEKAIDLIEIIKGEDVPTNCTGGMMVKTILERMVSRVLTAQPEGDVWWNKQ